MSSRRLLKAAEAIREVVSMAILADLRDPRVRDVTVTRVEVLPDMRSAKIHVSIMGNDTQQSLALRGLQSAAGFLQSRIAERIDTRYTPRLTFVLDQGVKKSIEMARLLREVLPPEGETGPAGEMEKQDSAGDDEGEETDSGTEAFDEEDESNEDDRVEEDSVDEDGDEGDADDPDAGEVPQRPR